MQPEIVTFTKAYCPHCKATKARFTEKGVSFTNYDVDEEPARLEEMISRSGGRMTVPQIFIGDIHVGGNSDLVALDEAGKLDALLRSE